MKSLIDYILESRTTGRPVIPFFNAAQISLLQKHIKDAEVEVDFEKYKVKSIKFSERNNNIFVSYMYCSTSDNKWHTESNTDLRNLVNIGATYIDMGRIKLYVDTAKVNDRSANCSLIEMTYKGGKTKLVFEVDCHGFLYSMDATGTVTIEIPCDLVNAKNESSFDCNAYDDFMKEHLPAKAKYLKSINVDDIVSWSSSFENGSLIINIELPVGKGYSSNHRIEKYEFNYVAPSYKCNKRLYDDDFEAQVIRKFINGIYEFLHDDKLKTPERVTIIISQELD